MPNDFTEFYKNKLGMDLEKDQEPLPISQEEIDDANLEEASYHRSQAEELCKTSLDFLAGMVMPTVFKSCFPAVLLAAWQLLTQCAFKYKSVDRIALGIPRGHGKTTLVKIFIIFIILFTKRKFILIMGSTSTLSENIIADICDMLSEKNVQRVFGDWRLGVELNRQDLKKFGFRGRNIILAAIGAEGSIRGLNIKNERPDVMVFEDIQTKECSESEVQSLALLRWMVGTAMKARSPHGCLTIFSGNMYPGKNSILKKLKTNARWIKFISGAILSDGTALWEEVRSLESLIEELDNDTAIGHPEIFFSEVLNDTEAGINTRTDLSLIRAWPWHETDQPQGKFILIDPSAGKKKSDDVVIGYFEVFDSIPGLREVIEENLSPGNTIRRALLMALTTGTKVIVAEGTAYQSTLLYWFGVIAAELGLTGFHFLEINTSSVAKNSRIMEGLKSLTAHEIDVHPEVRNLVLAQISNWNPLKRENVDGILDLIAYCTKVIELYGPLIATDTDVTMLDWHESKVADDNHAF